MRYMQLLFSYVAIAAFSMSAFSVHASTYNKQVGSDRVQLQWNSSATKACSSMNGTVFTFAGGAGTDHGTYKTYLNDLESKLGRGCVRLIRVNVNPGSDSKYGGYWLHHDSYMSASGLMAQIISNAQTRWKDASGKTFAQGRKTIVVGLSAGAAIAAAAMEYRDSYLVRVHRTIMLSGPLGADVSYECRWHIENPQLKAWIDRIFQTNHACASVTGNVDESKDVVYIKNQSFRPYLQPHNEIAIFVGKNDKIGCSSSGCRWSAARAAVNYINNITRGSGSYFVRVDQNTADRSKLYSHMLYQVNGGHDDMWQSSYVRQEVCKHAFAEVNEWLGVAQKIPYSYCN